MKEKQKYTEMVLPEREAIEKALKEDNSHELQQMVVGVAMLSDDPAFSQQLCLRLSKHQNEFVRGNAILGLGHLARRFKLLADDGLTTIEKGLLDSSKYVRDQAWASADDITHFLGLKVSGFEAK